MVYTTVLVLSVLLLGYVLICVFYYLLQERLLFVPDDGHSDTFREKVSCAHEDVFLDGEAGAKLHALWLNAKNARGAMLYFHGNTGTVDRWALIAEEFVRSGFDVLLPDYRGYGKSVGHRNEELLYSDALAWYRELEKKREGVKLCVYGRSLGSGLATWLCSRVKPQALVLETPFNALADVARFHSAFIPVKALLKYSFDNTSHLAKARCSVLIAHGDKDKVVPYRLGKQLYEEVKEEVDCEMLSVPGGEHHNLSEFPAFRNALNQFFDRHFPSAEADTKLVEGSEDV